jgi:pterin-4a-carbinolamine dehydratase
MKLTELFENSGKTVAVTFGRLNPPTIGHQKLVNAVLKQKTDAHFLFVSQTQKTTGKNQTRLSNPIPFDVKLEFIKKAFPNIAIGDTSVSTAIGMLQYLEKQGFENVIFVGGSDRVADFDALFNKQNGVDYNLKSIQVVSSGERDPDAEGAEGMSASKMRQAAINDDFKSFESGLPVGLKGDAQEVFSAVKQGLEPWIEQKVGEGIKSKLAGAALAATNLLGSPAQAAEEPNKPITIAYVMIDGEVRKYNLGDKFSDAREAEKFISGVLDKKGLSGYTLDIKHGYPKKKDVKEEKFRSKSIEDYVIPNKKLNDLKSKYLPDWEMLDHKTLQAKYVAKDHRHAEEFVSYINKTSEEMDHFAEVTQDVAEVTVKTSTFDVKGLTVLDFKLASKVDKYAESNDIEQVRMKGNFGMHESSHGRYWCSTDKKWKYRKGPKQKRSS